MRDLLGMLAVVLAATAGMVLILWAVTSGMDRQCNAVRSNPDAPAWQVTHYCGDGARR